MGLTMTLRHPLGVLSFGLLLGSAAATVTIHESAAAKPSTIASPEVMQAARRHYTSGNEALGRSDLDTARGEFEQAYLLLPLPEFLLALSNVAEKQERTEEAIRYAEQYLAAVPRGTDTTAVQVRIDALKARRPRTTTETVAPSVPVDSSRVPSLWPPIAVSATGVALIIVAGGLGGASHAAAAKLTDPALAGTMFTMDLLDTYNYGKTTNAAAVSIGVIGGVVLAGGLGWLGYVLYQRRNAVMPIRATSMLRGLPSTGEFAH